VKGWFRIFVTLLLLAGFFGILSASTVHATFKFGTDGEKLVKAIEITENENVEEKSAFDGNDDSSLPASFGLITILRSYLSTPSEVFLRTIIRSIDLSLSGSEILQLYSVLRL
jgi:hypothetical protein